MCGILMSASVPPNKNLSIVFGREVIQRTSGILVLNGFDASTSLPMQLTAGINIELSPKIK